MSEECLNPGQDCNKNSTGIIKPDLEKGGKGNTNNLFTLLV
jgi:hypothetical protein